VPPPGAVVPVHPLDRCAVGDVLVEPVLPGAVPQVVLDLLLRREQAAPVRVQLEGVGVQRRRHVTRAPRVLVVPPRPAEIKRLVQDHEVVVTRLLQRDPHPDAAEPGPHDHDPWHVRTITQPPPPGHASFPLTPFPAFAGPSPSRAPLRSPLAAGLAAPPLRPLSASLSPLLSHIIPAHLFVRISHLISK